VAAIDVKMTGADDEFISGWMSDAPIAAGTTVQIGEQLFQVQNAVMPANTWEPVRPPVRASGAIVNVAVGGAATVLTLELTRWDGAPSVDSNPCDY